MSQGKSIVSGTNQSESSKAKSGSRHRRLARSLVIVPAVGLLIVGGIIIALTGEPTQRVFGVPACVMVGPISGPARPWEADVAVSTYSTVNARHGNLFTSIPIVSWSGVGPDMDMRLYHNSALVNTTFDLTTNVGFNLGPGWTIAYSDQLILTGISHLPPPMQPS